MHKTNLTENHPHSALLPISLNATCVYSKSILNPIPNTEPFKLTANPFLNTKHTFTIEPSCSLVAPVKKAGGLKGDLGRQRGARMNAIVVKFLSGGEKCKEGHVEVPRIRCVVRKVRMHQRNKSFA
eukprot:TRINITY_DN6369_c0_g1_i1.p1 TRINITY_DN6369_c0_g1~~TRINITY_DN6369_c0_g1_i1.p1  ORF type:complete len:126 (-),score=23.01 TRINITY_DN6369_c0_g1_i1:153-530(-)